MGAGGRPRGAFTCSFTRHEAAHLDVPFLFVSKPQGPRQDPPERDRPSTPTPRTCCLPLWRVWEGDGRMCGAAPRPQELGARGFGWLAGGAEPPPPPPLGPPAWPTFHLVLNILVGTPPPRPANFSCSPDYVSRTARNAKVSLCLARRPRAIRPSHFF